MYTAVVGKALTLVLSSRKPDMTLRNAGITNVLSLRNQYNPHGDCLGLLTLIQHVSDQIGPRRA